LPVASIGRSVGAEHLLALHRTVGNQAVARRLTRLPANRVARVNVDSAEYLRGYNDGRGSTGSHPGPLIGPALEDYEEGYRAGRAESETAQASLGAAGTAPNRTSRGGRSPVPAIDQAAFERIRALLVSSGVPVGQQQLPNATVTISDASRILSLLVGAHPSLVGTGPRMVAARILQDVVRAGEDTTITAIADRLTAFRRIIFLRADGYVARALTGEAIQRAGRMEFVDGRLRAGSLETGTFYYSDSGVFYRTDENLDRTGNPIGELGLEHDAFNSALDGAADAAVGLVTGLAQLLRHPIDSIAALRQLPSAIVQLIQNAPDYWERFQAMPLNDQIREVSNILTTLLTLYGGAAGTTTRLAAAAGELGNVSVRVLTLSARGELALATVSVPVGTMATALSGGPGAVYVLHMANTAITQAGGGPAGGSGGGSGGGRLIVPAGRTLSAEEAAIANQLVAEGRTVEALAESNVRTADFLVDGVRTELKSISNITSPDPSGALARRILEGAGQAPNIVADVRQQAGMTEELARRAARRAYGADRAARIQDIRLIGQGFDVRVPRIVAPPSP
jgi:hypothetical protein